MQYYDQQFQTLNDKIKRMEDSISFLQDSIMELSYHIKDTQSVIIKLSHMQNETNEKVSMWPFVTMPLERSTYEEKN